MYVVVIAIYDASLKDDPAYKESIVTWGAFPSLDEADAYFKKSDLASKPYYRWHQVCRLVK